MIPRAVLVVGEGEVTVFRDFRLETRLIRQILVVISAVIVPNNFLID